MYGHNKAPPRCTKQPIEIIDKPIRPASAVTCSNNSSSCRMRGRAQFSLLDVYESSVVQISKILSFLIFLWLLLGTPILEDGFLGFVPRNVYSANSAAQGSK